MQASTIYDIWDLDRSLGLAYFDGREHGIPGQARGEGEAAAPRAYRIEISAASADGRTGSELSFSDGSSRSSAAAAAAAAANGEGVYSLDQAYSDVNYNSAANGSGDSARETRIAITSAPGASLQLEGMNGGGGLGNGADSLLICGDAECLALQNGNLNSGAGRNGAAGNGLSSYRSASEQDLVMIASLAEPVAMVDAPEPATFLPLGAGLVIFGAMKRKKKQQQAVAAGK